MKKVMCCLVIAVSSISAFGVVVPLNNASFETPAQAVGAWTSGGYWAGTDFYGWTVQGGYSANVWGGLANNGWAEPDGQQHAYMSLRAHSYGDYYSFGLKQDTSATAVNGQEYKLSYSAADYYNTGVVFSVSLLIDNAVVATQTYDPTGAGWELVSALYTASATDAGKSMSVMIGADHLGTYNDGTPALFDNVVLETVPEPATIALLALSALFIRKRQ